jgi:hypothetical protein
MTTRVNYVSAAEFAKTHTCSPDWIAAVGQNLVPVLTTGQRGTTSGYEASVVRHYSDGMYEVRVPGGVTCISWQDFDFEGKWPDPDSLVAVVIGNEYEFYAEMQQAEMPAHERMRNYTTQKVTVIAGPLPKDPETSDLFVVRAADGREFEAYEEELNGWDKALGQYYWPDGSFGPERDKQFLCNEQKGQNTEETSV